MALQKLQLGKRIGKNSQIIETEDGKWFALTNGGAKGRKDAQRIVASYNGLSECREMFEAKMLTTDDPTTALFPLVGEDAELYLRTKRDTLQWVLEMLPEAAE